MTTLRYIDIQKKKKKEKKGIPPVAIRKRKLQTFFDQKILFTFAKTSYRKDAQKER